MTPSSSSFGRLIALAWSLVMPGALAAQLITLETVPIAAGKQLAIFPSHTAGMGGVSIALDDALQDPFVNPSKGARVGGSQLFSVPVWYDVSNEYGAARTLPMGVLWTSGDWFAGGVAALQELRPGSRFANSSPLPGRLDAAARDLLPSPNALVERAPTNKYFHGFAGRTLAGGRLALGVGAFAADLNGTAGVEQLFADAWEIDEYGHVMDLRIGFTAELADEGRLEAVLLHNRVDMTHDVTSVLGWTLTDSVRSLLMPEMQDEVNLNRTRTWGLHLGYDGPLTETGWKVGTILTGNRKQHPKIPTYDLLAVDLPERDPIPRDPGDTWAFDVGVGVARERGATTFGLDVIYEPAWSYTWAESEAEIVGADGAPIPAGGKTVENWFTFSNASAAAGMAHQREELTLQLGVHVKTIDYRLRQNDHVTGIRRRQTEQWTQWTPTWGLLLTFPGVELRYAGSASSAARFPFFFSPAPTRLDPGRIFDGGEVLLGGDVLAPPTGALGIPDATTVTHRLGISLPIR